MNHDSESGFLNATELLEEPVLKDTPFPYTHHQVGKRALLLKKNFSYRIYN